jgi:hypothetical protein
MHHFLNYFCVLGKNLIDDMVQWSLSINKFSAFLPRKIVECFEGLSFTEKNSSPFFYQMHLNHPAPKIRL